MDVQWPLVVFTVLTGCGGWMAACIAYDEFARKARNAGGTNFVAAIVAVCLLAAGGFASVLHLSHPDNMLNALSHPTSGIFVEAVLVGLCAACLLLYLIALKRGSGVALRKTFAVAGALLGVALSFMAGHSYLMASVPAWNTLLLPLGYLCTAIPSGVGAYALVVGLKGAEGASTCAGALVIGGCAAVAGAVLYALGCGASLDAAAVVAVAVCVLGGAGAAVCGALVKRDAGRLTAWAGGALACALVGSLAFRVLMWLLYNPLGNFFGGL